ncbi:putative HTH-type transcriptional regulator YtcD [Paenibacillus allorhizoplanae]|uniref:HTH-type transcriptional regulator YtcD n=1 Tax=Paenibacillus allorhizoplanae TaxID=2905648 RepID=A0ABN8HB83_9BACL|nr:winged helix-turn-helix transcriptional regulator [Paenibacillus allorhizoplanae]CAH1232029.1 putative HTH-type transcriptional regulator YtcD [Paenibacillus allorhizoplanae]
MAKKLYNISVEATLEVIGGKWKCVILCHLTHGKRRTSDLKRLMPRITQKMLTQQLRELEDDGIVERIVYNQVPPKVEYALSEYGASLKPILDSLCMWGETHIIKEYGDKFVVLEENVLNKRDEEVLVDELTGKEVEMT